jgi:hypothetical protein
LKVKGAPARFLSRLFAAEIDHKNIVNILEASALAFQRTTWFAADSRWSLDSKRAFSAIANGGRGHDGLASSGERST